MDFSPNKVRAIFLDYGGTLDAPGIAWKEHFYPIYLRHGVKVDMNTFSKAFYAADDSLVAENPSHLNLTEIVHEQVRRVLTNLGCFSKELARAISEEFVASSLTTIKKNLNHLRKLKGRYKLGIISNNYGNLQAICQETGLNEVMDIAVDSNVVGCEKPDPRIFEYALTHLGVSPEESVMIGDNIKRDILGARSVGMNTILISSGTLPDDVSVPEDCPIISDLAELVPIFLKKEQMDC